MSVFRKRFEPRLYRPAPFIPSKTASANIEVTPGPATLTITTFAPTVLTPREVTPGVASLTLTTFAPTVAASDNKNVIPGTASLTLTTFAPTVSATANVNVTPGVASLTLTTFAPTVTAGGNKEVIPGTASLTITTFAPTVAAPRNVTPGTASLTLTLFSPTVSTPRNVTPGPASLTLTAFAPTVDAGAAVDVTPGPASLTLTTFAPTVEASIDDVPVVTFGGDDAPKGRRKRRKERHELFREIETTIHGLLHPETVESAERALPALDSDGTATGRAARAVDELLILAQGQHDLLQRAAAIRAELDRAIEARNRMLDQDEEDALIWMF